MNVILITLDACRLDHLSFAGYNRDTCPNLSKITGEGTLFLKNYTVIPQSEPAIVSILTGMYPHNHGIRTLGLKKSLNVTTIQEIFKSYNYKTACMAIEQQHNDAIKKGFDEFNLLRWRLNSKAKRTIKKIFDRGKNFGVSEIITDNAINWVKKNKTKKFFLYMHYMELHWPYSPPSPYDHIFDPDYKGKHTFNDLGNGRLKKGDLVYNNELSEEERNHAIAHYDGGILYMDSQIGRFVDFLKADGIWDNSIIVIVGDHGEHFGENNLYYHHVSSVYEPALRVPLFIKAPNIGSKKISALTQSIDIMPTVLDLLKIPLINYIDGKNLTPIINGKLEKIRDYAFAESGFSLFKQNKRKYVEGDEGKWRMITDGKWKLIFIPHPTNNIYELYNIAQDHYEENNLIEQEKEMTESLKQKLHQWIEKKDTEIEDIKSEPYSTKDEKKVKERLRSLGYLD